MSASDEFDAIPPRPAFEPSELIDDGDAGDLTRSGTSGTSDSDG